MFLSDPVVEVTNWRAEQAIRPAVVNREVWGSNRTATGSRSQEVRRSVLETCHWQPRWAVGYLSHTLRSFGNPLVPRPLLLAPR